MKNSKKNLIQFEILIAGIVALSLSQGCTHKKIVTNNSPAAPVTEQSAANPKYENAPIQAAQSLEDPIHFDFDRATLTEASKAHLREVLQELRMNPSKTIQITGACDERGSVSYNLKLGQRRANSAKAYLEENGILPMRISTVSIGKSHPIALGHDEESWALNRRDGFTFGISMKSASLAAKK